METLQESNRVLYQAQASRNPPSFEENDAWVTNQSIEPRYPQPDRAAAVVALSSWRMVERNQGDKGGRGQGGRRNGWMGSIGFYLHVLINASPPSYGRGGKAPIATPAAAGRSYGHWTDYWTCLRVCVCPYKCASSPAFRTITVSTRMFIHSSEYGMNPVRHLLFRGVHCGGLIVLYVWLCSQWVSSNNSRLTFQNYISLSWCLIIF